MTDPDKLTEILPKLTEPFAPDRVSWKPQITTKKVDGRKEMIMRNGKRVAGCMPYIDARDVMNRLDDVVGGQWSDSYREMLGGKNVECTLTIYGVSRADVGQVVGEDGTADPMKTLYSDAFKRAAVKFGIGRHLYDEEIQWLPYDGYRVDTSAIGGGNAVVVEHQQPQTSLMSDADMDSFKAEAEKMFASEANGNQVYQSLRNKYPELTLTAVNGVWRAWQETNK